MIAKQHDVVAAQVALKPRPLIEVERDALIVVIGEVRKNELRRLIERQQAGRRGRHRGPVGRMQMDHAAGVLADLVYRRMDGEARGIDGIRGVSQSVAVGIDLDEARSGSHSPVGGILPAPWSKETALSYMDDAGIDVAITSISTPGVHMGDDSAARDLARRVNELSAELIQERPDRSIMI